MREECDHRKVNKAGPLVVGDVDPVARVIAVYRADPHRPDAVFAPGDVADAEPAVPDWRMDGDAIFA